MASIYPKYILGFFSAIILVGGAFPSTVDRILKSYPTLYDSSFAIYNTRFVGYDLFLLNYPKTGSECISDSGGTLLDPPTSTKSLDSSEWVFPNLNSSTEPYVLRVFHGRLV